MVKCQMRRRHAPTNALTDIRDRYIPRVFVTCLYRGDATLYVKALAAARKDSDRFIGISLNDPNLKEYVKKSQLGFPVVSIAGYSSIKELPLGVTPETIVVSPTGQVIKNWLGAYAFGQEKEVEKYFGVKLPGLLAGAEGSSTASH